MMTHKERVAIAEKVMDLARKAGAKASSVRISTRRNVQVEVREGQIDKLQEALAQSLNLDLYLDGKYSSHATQKMDGDSLQKFVEDAVALTRYLSPDTFRQLPEAELSRLQEGPELDLMDSAYHAMETPRRIELAKATEAAAAKGAASPLISASASYSDTLSQGSLLNSLGFQGEFASSDFNLSAEVTVKDGERGRPEDYAYASVRHLADLASPEELGKEAARRALAKLGQTKLPTGGYDLLIENRVAANLLSGLVEPMAAASIQQKNSFLDGRLGKAIAASRLTLVDDPFVRRGLGSQRFDGEGIASNRRVLIEGGLLKAYLLDNYYARKLGLKPTGGSTANLVLEGGRGSLDDLVKTLGRGILVNAFIGGNYNATTGDFSYGVMGQYVEGGKIVKPVNEMNLTGNMVDLWSHLEAIGGDPFVHSSWRTPSLLFRGTQLSGA